jgi:hypothetical protein
MGEISFCGERRKKFQAIKLDRIDNSLILMPILPGCRVTRRVREKNTQHAAQPVFFQNYRTHVYRGTKMVNKIWATSVIF